MTDWQVSVLGRPAHSGGGSGEEQETAAGDIADPLACRLQGFADSLSRTGHPDRLFKTRGVLPVFFGRVFPIRQ